MRLFASWHEPALLTACAAVLAAQVLVPGFIGLADNGDFAKVAGPLSLAAKGGPSNFDYFVAGYLHSGKNYWDSGVWSTALPLAWLAQRLAGATREGAVFDIRWLGALHAAILLCALYGLLRSLRALPRGPALAVAVAAAWIFTDVNYAAYFNSFYTDTAALLGLLLMIPAAVDIATRGAGTGNLAWFFLSAFLFAGSKPQHAVWAFLPAAFLVFADKKRGAVAGVVLLAAAAVSSRLVPRDYNAAPLFTVIFSRLAVQSQAPRADLAELGLPAGHAAYIGMNAYSPGAPVLDRAWRADFQRRTGYGALARWYLRHPLQMFSVLDETLRLAAFQMRAQNLSNFERRAGRPPLARTERFALWSDLRSALFVKWPYHIAAWYLLVFALALHGVFKRRRTAWIVLGVAALGAGEFSVAALADAAETHRHLFLFHACTDVTICFGVAWLLTRAVEARRLGERLDVRSGHARADAASHR